MSSFSSMPELVTSDLNYNITECGMCRKDLGKSSLHVTAYVLVHRKTAAYIVPVVLDSPGNGPGVGEGIVPKVTGSEAGEKKDNDRVIQAEGEALFIYTFSLLSLKS